MKKIAVIVAAGAGLRMGSELPKQFLPLNGKPVLQHTLETFLNAYEDLEIIVVINPRDAFHVNSIIQSTGFSDRIKIVNGGDTRYHSVQNGLKEVPNDTIVFVQDAVRCLTSVKLIHDCYERAVKSGNAIPAVTATDTIRIERNGGNELIDRNSVRLIQTPQTFQSTLIKNAFESEYKESFTDEASVLENAGEKIHLIEGEKTNIKITTPIDLIIAEKILENRTAAAYSSPKQS